MPISIRPVVAADIAGVVSLVADTLAEFGLQFGVGAETDQALHRLPASYVDVGGQFFVAVDESGTVLGTAGVCPVAPDVFELRKMYLRQSARGQQLGLRLYQACLDFCRQRGAKAIVLDTVEAMQKAIAFYERLGFRRDDAQVRGSRCTRGYRLDL